MTREEKIELLNKLLEIEEKNDIGNLTRAERGEFQQWINDAKEQEPCEDAISRQAVIKNQKIVYQEYCKTDNEKALMEELARLNNELTPVNPKEPKTDVLDKIRAEIEKLADDEWNKQVGSVSQGLEDAIEIIDKYKAESEDKE